MEDFILATIRRSLITVLPDVEEQLFSEERTLADLGCNSIDRADVITMTMDELGISVAVSEFRNVREIRGLADLLRKHAQ